MRLIHYLSMSGLDEKTNKFRSMSIKLIDKPLDYSPVLDHVVKEYGVDCNKINNDIDNLNKNLRNIYKGKYKFSLCLDEGVTLDNIKINKKYVKRIKLLQLEYNDNLSQLKTEVERKSKEKYKSK